MWKSTRSLGRRRLGKDQQKKSMGRPCIPKGSTKGKIKEVPAIQYQIMDISSKKQMKEARQGWTIAQEDYQERGEAQGKQKSCMLLA